MKNGSSLRDLQGEDCLLCAVRRDDGLFAPKKISGKRRAGRFHLFFFPFAYCNLLL